MLCNLGLFAIIGINRLPKKRDFVAWHFLGQILALTPVIPAILTALVIFFAVKLLMHLAAAAAALILVSPNHPTPEYQVNADI